MIKNKPEGAPGQGLVSEGENDFCYPLFTHPYLTH